MFYPPTCTHCIATKLLKSVFEAFTVKKRTTLACVSMLGATGLSLLKASKSFV